MMTANLFFGDIEEVIMPRLMAIMDDKNIASRLDAHVPEADNAIISFDALYLDIIVANSVWTFDPQQQINCLIIDARQVSI